MKQSTIRIILSAIIAVGVRLVTGSFILGLAIYIIGVIFSFAFSEDTKNDTYYYPKSRREFDKEKFKEYQFYKHINKK